MELSMHKIILSMYVGYPFSLFCFKFWVKKTCSQYDSSKNAKGVIKKLNVYEFFA